MIDVHICTIHSDFFESRYFVFFEIDEVVIAKIGFDVKGIRGASQDKFSRGFRNVETRPCKSVDVDVIKGWVLLGI